MCNAAKAISASFALALFVIVSAASQTLAQGAAWRVSKSSGEVWVSTSGVQQVSLSDVAALNPGDTIRTGRNGRVLLVRGQETILISPNSVVGLPAQKSPGSTTIIQQSGSILIEVEKRNNPHFEVETPYLAAVVKGTQFRVSVSQSESYVNVLRGQVDVTDLKSGQTALVMPGQMAKVWALGNGGLLLSGSGTLNPIRRGAPRTTTIMPVQASVEGLSAPDSAPGKQVVVMPPRGDVASFPTAYEGSPRNDGFWNSSLDYVGNFFGRGNNKAQVRDERDAAMIAIPLGFGAMIAVVVAVKRRRQKQKQK
jgi:FecR protein